MTVLPAIRVPRMYAAEADRDDEIRSKSGSRASIIMVCLIQRAAAGPVLLGRSRDVCRVFDEGSLLASSFSPVAAGRGRSAR